VGSNPSPSITERSLSLPAASTQTATLRPRVVVISSGVEMTQLLQDILVDDYDVISQPHPTTITAIDAKDPHVVIVGTLDGGLKPEEIVALAAGHMRLRHVPLIVMSFGSNLLEGARRLSWHPGVRLVSLPFDADTVLSVVNSVMAPARASHR
jgi:hypothetical protein